MAVVVVVETILMVLVEALEEMVAQEAAVVLMARPVMQRLLDLEDMDLTVVELLAEPQVVVVVVLAQSVALAKLVVILVVLVVAEGPAIF